MDEDVDSEMNDWVIEFFGNDELDCNSGSVANVSDIHFPAANVHSSSSGSPSFNCPACSKNKSATWRWKSTDEPSENVQCELTANILLHFCSDPRPFDVFEKAIDLNKLISHIVAQTNLYESQYGCNFVTNDAEMKTFLGMNSIMSINKFPSIEHYWSTGKYIGNQGLRDVMTKSRFKEILHKIHFSDNDTADSNSKGNKVRPLIDHFNEAFQSAMANSLNQSIDKHMIEFKGRSSMKQYIKSKPIKWDLNSGFVVTAKPGICMSWICI